MERLELGAAAPELARSANSSGTPMQGNRPLRTFGLLLFALGQKGH